ncbi:nickel-dependent lactate racemase [candidate division KSB1 bacterium]|nr:nickel-dependent lactate racemase [candidate division KSB1 bacterium]
MELQYGSGRVVFTPDSSFTWNVVPDTISDKIEHDSRGVLTTAIDELILQLKQRSLPAPANFLIIIPDHTRRCRGDEVLSLLLPMLEQTIPAKCEILVANGSHKAIPDRDIQELVGDDILKNYLVSQHVADDPESLYWLGETKYGTPIWLNKKVRDCDFIITIGGILFHYFAGFGGGPKMLLPGVAGLETIRCNHRRTIDLNTGQFHPNCQEGNIDTNPVFLDLAEIVKFIPNVLSLQLLLSPDYSFIAAEAGEILPVHRLLCEKVRRLYGIPLSEKADVVIASAGGYPADVNLIQSHKSIHHAFQAVKENGVLIILAECSEGSGSKFFLPYFEVGSSKQIAARLMKDYQINGHTALSLKNKTERAIIILVSELEDAMVIKTGMMPAKNIDQAWSIAKTFLPESGEGFIFPNAGKYLPYLI